MTWIWNIDPYIRYIFDKENIKGLWIGGNDYSSDGMGMFTLTRKTEKKSYEMTLLIRETKIVSTAKIFDPNFNLQKLLKSLKRGRDYFIFIKKVE